MSAKEATKQAPFFPFCSERCKLIDLGAWLDVEYRITSDPQSKESEQSTNHANPHADEE